MVKHAEVKDDKPVFVEPVGNRTLGFSFEVGIKKGVTSIHIHTEQEGNQKDYKPIFLKFKSQIESGEKKIDDLSVNITIPKEVNLYVIVWVLQTFRDQIRSLDITCPGSYLMKAERSWNFFPSGETCILEKLMLWNLEDVTTKSYITLPEIASLRLSQMTGLTVFSTSHTIMNPSVVLKAFPYLRQLKEIVLLVNLTTERNSKTLLRDTLVKLVKNNQLADCFLSVDQSESHTPYISVLMDLLSSYATAPLKLYMMVDDAHDKDSGPLESDLTVRDVNELGLLRFVALNDQNAWGFNAHHLIKVTNLLAE